MIDKIDIKILHEIIENPRESHNKLAKKIRISREVFDYRIKRLEEKEIIEGYQTRLNLAYSQNFQFHILLIQTIGNNNEKEVIEKLKENNKTLFMEKLGGIYNYLIGFVIEKPQELKEYLDFIDITLSENKLSLNMLTVLEEIKDSLKPLFSEKSIDNRIKSVEYQDKNILLDKIDKKIIEILLKNGTTSSPSISNQLSLTAVAIRKRIKNLEEKKVILGFRTHINLSKLGYQINNLLIKINTTSQQTKKNIKDFIANSNEIFYSAQLAGEYDYIVSVANKNNFELSKFINILKTKFTNIKEINIIPVFENLLQQHKLN